MLAWMIYAVLVTLALSAAALIAEQATRQRRLPTRWPWLLAMVASLMLPIAIATVTIPVPAFVRATAPAAGAATATASTPIVLRETTSIPLASKVLDWSGTTPYTASVSINTVLQDIWLASSFTLLLFLGLSTALFHRRKRSWTPGYLSGSPVLVSEATGPAVVGLIRSRIVVPAWVLEESAAQQRYVMAHEQSHLEARDPLLVACSLVLLLGMPWNPLLWWQLHRLRCAIEVDCDARVLRGGGDLGEYCETLIQVGKNQSEYVGAVTAMSESTSFLERRVKIMLSKPKKWAGAFAFVLISVSLGVAVFAAQVTPPSAPAQPGIKTVAVDRAILDGYVGVYKLSDYSTVTVARRGDGLTASPIGQLIAQGTIDIYPLNDSEFLIPSIDVTLQFVKPGGSNQATSVIVREHGVIAMQAPRIDQATADDISGSIAARVKDQKPYPNSGKALQLILTNARGGPGMSPLVAQIADSQHDAMEKYYAFLGPVQSYKFEGVADYGWDIYDVQYAHGAQQVFIQLDKNGVLVSSVMRRQ